ncbi:unnamed protein product [Adineta steineri]|uniref:Uncharacterized protein n=1 Tax=Adineta steineri TaxID=433720 RepID=A0A814LBC7_9BILA|nr:unnamed protein product [Adineta steineri]CAF1063523.1 unnamed protein product [Adineta steineri]CAF1479761.1 unnamed protein product [Adineta steineri]CAF3617908.1 unnamed protein product [Adineta steineri]CAF3711881.1 unnamed protein product [Adineta steineri]
MLKACRLHGIIPKFLWFKTANDHLTTSSVYKNCQRLLHNLRIHLKYRNFHKAKQEYLASLDLLKNIISDGLFKHLKEVILYISLAVLQEKEYRINRKLYPYVKLIKPKTPINRKIITNLSNRVLTNKEADCLVNDLEYGLVSRRVDDMNVISNAEQLFRHTTNTYHHHKPFMDEFEEKNKVVARDIRLLTTQ